MTQTEPPFVSIVVPVLNEQRYIAQCLASLLYQGQNWGSGQAFEILVMDGGSTDGTAAIVRGVAAANPAIRLVDNPGRLQSAAMNLAASMAAPQATVLLRADAHAGYPANFLAACVAALLEKRVPSVVVPMIAVGERGFQRATAEAQNSLLGNGGSAHRRASASSYVDHGHHAAFDRAFFRKIGGYNETFSHNEDAEYDHRVNLAGGRVWLCGEVIVTHFPRTTPDALARQYFRHGTGRMRTLLLHRVRPRLRQMIPPMVVAGSVGALLLSPLLPVLAVLPALYAATCMGYGAVEAARQRAGWLLAMGPAIMIMHCSWASGFIWTCLRHGLPARSLRHSSLRPATSVLMLSKKSSTR